MDAGYGPLLAPMMKRLSRFDDRGDVFRKLGIPSGHWNNVINPNKVSSSGNRFYCPAEWGVALTRASGDYTWLRALAWDCGALILTPGEIERIVGLREKAVEAKRRAA